MILSRSVKTALQILIAAIALWQNGQVHAFNQFLGYWGEVYPGSNSDNAACQLCHQRPTGGDGWNEYGIQVRAEYLASLQQLGSEQSLKQALTFIEVNPSDPNDSGSPQFIDEITANTQPGWRVGEVNTVTTKGGSQQIISPPADMPPGVLIDQGSSETPQPTSPAASAILRSNITIKLTPIAENFNAPVQAVSAPGDNNNLYVVEQTGRVIRVNRQTGEKSPFLDFSSQLVALNNFDERGLLSLAFHPDFQSNGFIYTYLSKPTQGAPTFVTTMSSGQAPNHQTVVSRWRVVGFAQSPAAVTNELELMRIDQPQANHNGGTLKFGPDGYLYVSLGDGGAANDVGIGHGSDGNGRDFTNPLGTIMRIDVNASSPANGRYEVPADNPFVGDSGLDEVIAYGFRNPYRFAFEDLDDEAFSILVGDVGQGNIEEVDRISSEQFGGNYGWNYKEGTYYFHLSGNGSFISENPPQGVALPNLIDPIAEYDHDEGVSVIAGEVYQASDIPGLQGRFVFADWSRSFGSPQGRLFHLTQNNEIRELNVQSARRYYFTGFGSDNVNGLYVLGSDSFGTQSQGGALLKIEAAEADDDFCIPIKNKAGKMAIVCL